MANELTQLGWNEKTCHQWSRKAADYISTLEGNARTLESHITLLTAEVARLKELVEWRPITAENLPKAGDELLDQNHYRGTEWKSIATISHMHEDWDFKDYVNCGWTHFRPLAAPHAAAPHATHPTP